MESGSGNSSDRKYDPGKGETAAYGTWQFSWTCGYRNADSLSGSLFADAIKERQSMLGEKKKLYRSLGVIGGILIAVMLI